MANSVKLHEPFHINMRKYIIFDIMYYTNNPNITVEPFGKGVFLVEVCLVNVVYL